MTTIRSTLPALALPALALLVLAACNRAPTSAVTATMPAPAEPATISATAVTADADLIARGEYLVRIATCNDCHTPGYNESAGELPTAQWLVGSPIGFHGPWGTTYPANVRLKLQEMDEAAWMKYSGELHTRPVMPDFVLRAMQAEDRLAIFHFIKSLGPAGTLAPSYLPPDQKPLPPYWELVLPPGPPPQAPAAS